MKHTTTHLQIKYLIIIRTCFILFFLSSTISSFSQPSTGVSRQKDRVLKTIDSIFIKGFTQNVLKDSVAIYAINFKLEITRNKKGNAMVKEINVNDSLGYRLFPSYKRLYTINYKALLGSKEKITLLIPVLIANTSSEKRIDKKPDGNPLIDMQAALNAAYALSSDMPYDNEKEAGLALNHRIYKYYKRTPKAENRLKDIVLLNPYLWEIVNIPKSK